MEEELILDRRISEVSELLLVKAKEELGETDSVREESVKLIKEWIHTHNQHLSHLGKIFTHIVIHTLITNGKLMSLF